MVVRARCADPVRVSPQKVVLRGVGYGTVTGMGTAALLVAVLSYGDNRIGAVLGLTVIAGVVGAVVGSVVGMLSGVVFALAAPCLIRNRVFPIAAGLSVPAGFLAVIYSASPAGNWAKASLVIWAITAPAGGLTARRVLYGRRTSSAETAE